MDVSLPPDLQQFVDAQVSSGAYGDAGAVIRDGLQLLADRKAQVLRLDADIAAGLESARAGRVVPGQSVYDELKARRG